MELTRHAAIFTLVSTVLGLAAASHFRGSIIQWKPVDPDNFDGRVLFTHRIAWRRTSDEGQNCTASTVASGTLVGGGSLVCRSGCEGRNFGSMQYRCTDFSVNEDWSTGQGSNEVSLSGVTSFEASYTGFNWISLVLKGELNLRWEIRVKGDLTPRPDNGRINSSPTTAVPPVLRLRHGVTHTIAIPVSDADGDVVRCRWANSFLSECASVCQAFPATLDQDNCRLTYRASGPIGWYAVALQVEDFISASSTVAMSSVPVQFLVLVQNIAVTPDLTPPAFVGTTPEDRACIIVESTYRRQITARSGSENAIITDITTVSPPGLLRSPLTVLNSRESYINLTWTPTASQQGANIFCYTANDNFGLSSEQRCITLLVGVGALQMINMSLTSTGNLSLEYDQQIKRPSASRYVHVFQDDGMEVLSLDVSTSIDVVYFGSTLTIVPSTPFSATRMYYVMADSGIAVAAAFCPMESPAITLPTELSLGVTADISCAVNEYVDPASDPGLPICLPCPANSSSVGGNATVCMCNTGTGRVDAMNMTQPCIDIDECVEQSPCDGNAVCTNTPGCFTCACNEGYSGDGMTCTDVDECVEQSPCDGNAVCTNTPGSFTCDCNEGHSGDGMTCTDNDECVEQPPCDGNAVCTNTPGSFTCACNEGYSGDGMTCTDIDECVEQSPCDGNAVCTNTPGSFTCACNEGHSGDGITCTDNDECVEQSPCDGNAVCTNTPGSFACACTKGYSGDGMTCTDIDECVEQSPCDQNAQCTNTPGSFTCDCIEGYSGDGMTCEAPTAATTLSAPTAIRMNDTITGDPLYEVPIIVDEEGKALFLCYEVRGQANQHFNLISDTCVSVNALYSPMINPSKGNIISKIGILAEDNSGTCQQIEADLEGCTARVNGAKVTMYNQNGIQVNRRTNRIRISVPNCETEDLVMWVICEVHRGQPMIKFVVARGFNLRPTSHGLVGQFWNVEFKAEKYNVTAEDKITPAPGHYAVTVNAPGKTRRFFAWKHSRTWDMEGVDCLYSGNVQGGLLYEVTSLSDPVIQGTYTDYTVSGLFRSEYKYTKFLPQCL